MRRPLVKICGLTSEQEARACMELGADLLGFIFHASSRRCADPAMVSLVRSGGARKVGVFVKQGVSDVVALTHRCGLDMVQLHGGHGRDGNHGVEVCGQLVSALGRERIIKVFWPERYASSRALQDDLERFAPVCGWMLLDAGKGGGGHGRGFDPGLLSGVRSPRPWLLAGGLGPTTLPAVLTALEEPGLPRPHGVDMSSGVETAPGKKNLEEVKQVMRIIYSGAPERSVVEREE